MVFDAHSDIFTDVAVRRQLGETQVIKNHYIQQLKNGGMEGSCFVLWTESIYKNNPSKRLGELLRAAKEEMKECKEVVLVHNFSEIEVAKKEEKFYIFLGIEGLSGIGKDVEQLHAFYDEGVRHAMLTWNEENHLATGVRGSYERGLTLFGKRAVHIMAEKKMILDVSHLNEKSFWDVMNIVNRPILASHSNAMALAKVPRNLKDEQLLAIRDTSGLVGLNAFHMFIHDEPAAQTVDGFIKHAIYIAEKIGVEHLCFGFDFEEPLLSAMIGSSSLEENPCTIGLEDYSKVPMMLEKMKKYGFSEKEIKMISTENWYRFVKNVIGQ